MRLLRSAVAGMILITVIAFVVDRVDRRRASPAKARVNGILGADARIDRAIREATGTVALLYMDFECGACRKLWRETERLVGAARPGVDTILVLARSRDADPIARRIYDIDGRLREAAGVVSIPVLAVIEDGAIVQVLLGADEISTWYRSRTE